MDKNTDIYLAIRQNKTLPDHPGILDMVPGKELVQVNVCADDWQQAEQLAGYLNRGGFLTRRMHLTGADFSSCALHDANMILLVLSFPDTDIGVLLQALRKRTDLPVMAITTPEQYQDAVELLRVGLDDVLQFPFHTLEVYLRIRAIFRRRGQPLSPISIRRLIHEAELI